MDETEHRRLIELLGSYALDALPTDVRSSVTAHLDGCASCRDELGEIAPLAADLRSVDLSQITSPPVPAPDLGERIRSAVAAERVLVDARSASESKYSNRARLTRRALQAAAAAVLFSGGLLAGQAITSEPAVPKGPFEVIALTPSSGSGVIVSNAGLVPHTWGVEVRMVASGFRQGDVYRAAFRSRSGGLVPAGEFLGTGAKTITCNMQAALLRPETTEFVVMDRAGREVLTSSLT